MSTPKPTVSNDNALRFTIQIQHRAGIYHLKAALGSYVNWYFPDWLDYNNEAFENMLKSITRTKLLTYLRELLARRGSNMVMNSDKWDRELHVFVNEHIYLYFPEFKEG